MPGPRYALCMDETHGPAAITIRPAVPEDAEGIARTFLESAEAHARLDPERYLAQPSAARLLDSSTPGLNSRWIQCTGK